MKILFDKIGHNEKPFDQEISGIVANGTLVKSGYHRVMLQGKMAGTLEFACSSCGTEIFQEISVPLKLTISDQIIEDKDDLDIIEFLNGEIDISFIIESEINSLKSDYHYCTECDNNDEPFEMEF